MTILAKIQIEVEIDSIISLDEFYELEKVYPLEERNQLNFWVNALN